MRLGVMVNCSATMVAWALSEPLSLFPLDDMTVPAASRSVFEPVLPWLQAGDAFPPVDQAWGEDSPAPGLLAAGDSLAVSDLLRAYAHGVFPWFSEGQPVLWWSPEPRMLLRVADFKLHRSLRQLLVHSGHPTPTPDAFEVRFDTCFARVIQACASRPRPRQSGTWIVPDMVQAYTALHQAGHAHSVETWLNGELVGGLYAVNVGGMVFGESMFSLRSNASKVALAALVAFCRKSDIDWIDCQQNTPHLASLGAQEVNRSVFTDGVAQRILRPAPLWHFAPADWSHILARPTPVHALFAA